MLIATRDLMCFGQPVKKGQPIPDPKRWDVVALQSNINIGWVREATEDEAKALFELSKQDSPPRAAESEAGTEIHVKFACNKCSQSFEKKAALKSHLRRHK